MFKKFFGAVVVVVMAGLVMTGCAVKSDSESKSVGDEVVETTVESPEDSSGDVGIGFTYTGKPGISIGGGVVVPFDGSAPGFGF